MKSIVLSVFVSGQFKKAPTEELSMVLSAPDCAKQADGTTAAISGGTAVMALTPFVQPHKCRTIFDSRLLVCAHTHQL